MRPALLWITSLGLSALMLGATGQRAAHAFRQRREAEKDLDRAGSLVRELRTLRSTSAPGSAATGNLQPRLAAVLTACALPASTLQSVAPEPESAQKAGDGSSIRRRRATVVLQAVTLPGVGAFLDGWRRAEPGWVISAIDLTPQGSAAPGADLPIRAALTLEHLSIDAPVTGATPLDGLGRRSP